MTEFDLRSYLYNNPLLESEAKLKAAKKKLEKQEDKLDKVDMKDEDAKEKAKHHKDAIKNVKKEIKDLEKDLKFDEKAEKKEEKEAKKKKSVKEAHMDRDGFMSDRVDSGAEDAERKIVDNMPKMTREGLKDMIREKITSILNEEEIDESDARTYRGDSYNKRGVGVAAQPKSTSTADRQAYIDSLKEDEEIEEQEDIEVDNELNVKDKNVTDVDIEKDTEVDDVSKETDIDVKTSLPGESEDVDAVLGLLTKAKEESERFAAEDEELGTQIGNVITYFTRKHVAK